MEDESIKNEIEANNQHSPEEEVDPIQSRREQYPAGLFTNEDGNLKFVRLVVRHPCKVFFTILTLNLIMAIILFYTVASSSESPFSDPGSQYDTNDIRSLEYDSLRLAQEEVEDIREGGGRRSLREVHRLLNDRRWKRSQDNLILQDRQGLSDHIRHLQSSSGPRIQEEDLDFTFWVYEAEDSNGVFGSAESIRAMRESQALFLDDPNYQDFCWKRYFETNGVEISECRVPLSSLNIFYASSWDTEVAEYIISELQIESNVQRYNDLGLCVEFNLLCDEVPENYSEDDFTWARYLDANMTALTSKWDGSGELLEENIQQITTIMGHFLPLLTKRGLVDFGVDKNFSLENPISIYSRAIFQWGGPLAGNSADENNSDEDKEDVDEDTLKE